jgi:hypothetical protein
MEKVFGLDFSSPPALNQVYQTNDKSSFYWLAQKESFFMKLDCEKGTWVKFLPYQAKDRRRFLLEFDLRVLRAELGSKFRVGFFKREMYPYHGSVGIPIIVYRAEEGPLGMIYGLLAGVELKKVRKSEKSYASPSQNFERRRGPGWYHFTLSYFNSQLYGQPRLYLTLESEMEGREGILISGYQYFLNTSELKEFGFTILAGAGKVELELDNLVFYSD